jgi:presenilin-like A22 family membrane protease
MKHNLKVTLMLVGFFVLAQLIGLCLINISIKGLVVTDGVTSVLHSETSLGPRPEMSGLGAFAYVVIGVAVGTILVLIIIKLHKLNLWKAWFLLAVFIAISLALGVFLQSYLAFIIALGLALFKIFKPNIIIHNLTEVLMYAGIGVFLAPMLNVFWVSMLLIAISIYDFIAVFKSKHMVKMAEFQTESKVFAGLFIPYTTKKSPAGVKSKIIASASPNPPKNFQASGTSSKQFVERKNAVLGGGDIAFPLIFTGVVMDDLVLHGLSKLAALQLSLIITVTSTIALAALFIMAKKDKFYPAMPFISAGCFIGYGIVWLIGII